MMMGITSRITVAALLVAIPTFLLFAIGFWINIEQRQRGSLDLVRARANLLAARINDQAGDAESLLIGMGDALSDMVPNLPDADAKLQRYLYDLPAFYPELELIDPSGQLIGSAHRPTSPAYERGDAYRELAARLSPTRRDAVSDPVLNPISGLWMLQFERALTSPDGHINAALIVSLDLRRLMDLVASAGYSEASRVMLINEHDRVLFRVPDPSSVIGTDVSGSGLAQRASPAGAATMQWLNGFALVTGYTGLSSYPWTLFYGLPPAFFYEEDRNAIVWAAAISFAVMVFALVVARLMAGRITRPIARLTADAKVFADGHLSHRSRLEGPIEVRSLAQAFNATLDRLASENAARRTAEQAAIHSARELQAGLADLAAYSKSIELLGRLVHRLQSCARLEEYGPVVERLLPTILPGIPGALYLAPRDGDSVELCAMWGLGHPPPSQFAVEACWALRRGQTHAIADAADAEVRCTHLGEHPPAGYWCEPLIAQGTVLGLLYMVTRPQADTPFAAPDETVLAAVVENLSLAIANQHLRDRLRNDSIVDMLTGLFNRRYLEETLPLELARAARQTGSVGVLMIDIDHFKRYNSRHGHDGGDALLRGMGSLISSHIRKGDIACRYGGEEFTLILPGADIDGAALRANAIRVAAQGLAISHRGTPLGTVTLSAGIAAFPLHGNTADEVLRAADVALLRAKANGRNRVEVAKTSSDAEAPARVVPLSVVPDPERREG